MLGGRVGRQGNTGCGRYRWLGARRQVAIRLTVPRLPLKGGQRGGNGVVRAERSGLAETEDPRDCPIQGCWDDLTAADIMTSRVLSVDSNESIFKAMEILVENSCSGLAVIDEERKVLGVVSAYDVLALDCTPGQLDKSDGFFPPVDKCVNDFDGDRNAMWKDFLSLRKSIAKAKATLVGDSMHETYTVAASKLMTNVADFIVQKRLHRVFVVDEEDHLIGVISRGDIMRATVNNFRHYVESSSA